MRKGLRVLAGVLALSLMMPLVACKKKKDLLSIKKQKYVSGQEIKESDPYFNAEINQLRIPLDDSLELDYANIDEWECTGNAITATYSVGYKLPEGKSWSDLSMSESSRYYINATGIFDLSGNLIRNISDTDFGVLLYDISCDKDGNIAVLYLDIDSYYITEKLKLAILNPSGETLNTFTIYGFTIDHNSSAPMQTSFLPDGRYAICGQGKIEVYDQYGKKSYEISDTAGRKLGSSVISSDGKSYVISTKYSYENGNDIQIKELDLSTGELGKGIQANYLDAFGEIQTTEHGLFVSMGSGCYRFDIAKQELQQVFDWNDADVDRNFIEGAEFTPISENELVAMTTHYEEDYMQVVNVIHLTRAEKNPHAGKKMIVVGGVDLYSDENFLSFLYEYNHDTSNKARAVMLDYGEEYVNGDDLSELDQRLYLELLAGDGPDILMNFSDSSAFQTEAVMEDMNQYLDGPDGISRDMYFDNVFEAMEKDGKLYHVPLRFILCGLEVNSEILPNRDGWTFEEFEEAAESVPEGVSFIESMKYKDFLGMLLYCTMSDYVNYETKTVDFQNDSMKRILQMTEKYGVMELPSDEGVDTEYNTDLGFYLVSDNRTANKFAAGIMAVRKSTIGTLLGFCYNKAQTNFPTAYVGYPSSTGSGMAIWSLSSIGIVSTSKYKDLAWELVRAYLEFDPQNNEMNGGLPVNKNTFERESVAEMETMNARYEDMLKAVENGELYYGTFPQATMEDIDEIRRQITLATDAICYDKAMFNVIVEETAGYFAGDHTADEVLKNIQNRTATIVKEL